MKKLLTFLSLIFLFSLAVAQNGFAQRSAFLGVESDEISRSKARKMGLENPYGVLIDKVVDRSSADKAGLRPMDYLYRINRYEFDYDRDLGDILDNFRSGDVVDLYIVRKGKKIVLNTRLGNSDDRGSGYTHDGNGRPFLGVVDSGSYPEGLSVDVVNNSTAERAGMRDGDILQKIDGYPIYTFGDVSRALRNIQAGQNIELQYIGARDVQYATVRIEGRAEGWEDKFEKKMDAFAERMESFGERIESKAERWAEDVENRFEKNSPEYEAAAERFGRSIATDIVETIFNTKCEEEDIYRSSSSKAFLGIYSDRLSRKKAKYLEYDNPYGNYVKGIIDNTTASEYGLQAFDYIYGIDEYRTGENQSLGSILNRYRVGDSAELILIRKGKTKRIPIVFNPRMTTNHITNKECEQAFLGVIQRTVSKNGMVFINTVRNSAAERMGLKDGDQVININGHKIYDWTDLGIATDSHKPNTNMRVKVLRNGKKLSFSGVVTSKKQQNKEDCNDKVSLTFERSTPRTTTSSTSTSDENDDFNISLSWENDDKKSNSRSDTKVNTSYSRAIITEISASEANKFGLVVPTDNSLSVSKIHLSPNVNNDMFTLSFNLSNSGDTAVKIINETGREIYNYELTDFSGNFEDKVDIVRNGKGTYLLIISQNGKNLTKKILLQ